MTIKLPLKEMTLREKLSVMESLWDDLAGSPETIESRTWHQDILDERRRRIDQGEARFAD